MAGKLGKKGRACGMAYNTEGKGHRVWSSGYGAVGVGQWVRGRW